MKTYSLNLSQYQFKPLLADTKNKRFLNCEYLDETVKLFCENWHKLTDDFQQTKNPIDTILEQINLCYPYFYAILTPSGEYMGFCYLRVWCGNGLETHSCQVQGAIKKEFRGKLVVEAYNQLLDVLFNQLNLERVQMEIPENNKQACDLAERLGFSLEGIIRHATKKDEKFLNHKMYSILKEEFK